MIINAIDINLLSDWSLKTSTNDLYVAQLNYIIKHKSLILTLRNYAFKYSFVNIDFILIEQLCSKMIDKLTSTHISFHSAEQWYSNAVFLP